MNMIPVPSFYQGYVSLVSEKNIPEGLENNRKEIFDLYKDLTPEKFNFRYAERKWSVREVLQHITDTERIMAYRALRISRGDQTPLAGFEQEDYVKALKIDHLGIEELLEEWKAVRQASLLLFKNMHPDLYNNVGVAFNFKLSVEIMGQVIIGHTRHHLKILRERYL